MKRAYPLLPILIVITILTMDFVPVRAQGTPPVDPNGAWGEVVNPDGSINYANLTDGGVVTQPADWMPGIPLVGPVEAEYHVYYTPSGNTILMPTASTLFFMAANPNESGYAAAASSLGTDGLTTASGDSLSTGIAGLGSIYSALMGGGTVTVEGSSMPAEQFFDQVLSGQANIYDTLPDGLGNFLAGLFGQSSADLMSGNGLNLYTYMLLYPPSQCASVPGGCTPEQLSLLIPPPTVTVTETPPAPSACPAPVVTPGRIIRTGKLLAPKYPLVVGQDPDKRGVDVLVSVAVQPTIRTFWTSEPIVECKPGPNGNGVTNCTTNHGQTGHNKIMGWTCQEHVETYPECVSHASMTLRLTSDSRDWILNELSIRYPGAYLHKPTISFGASSGCQWTETYTRVPIEDPGNWDINVNGQTSGTPVSAPRPFGGAAGQFGVWLKEIAIIK